LTSRNKSTRRRRMRGQVVVNMSKKEQRAEKGRGKGGGRPKKPLDAWGVEINRVYINGSTNVGSGPC
jgi:hypothetical protein